MPRTAPPHVSPLRKRMSLVLDVKATVTSIAESRLRRGQRSGLVNRVLPATGGSAKADGGALKKFTRARKGHETSDVEGERIFHFKPYTLRHGERDGEEAGGKDRGLLVAFTGIEGELHPDEEGFYHVTIFDERNQRGILKSDWAGWKDVGERDKWVNIRVLVVKNVQRSPTPVAGGKDNEDEFLFVHRVRGKSRFEPRWYRLEEIFDARKDYARYAELVSITALQVLWRAEYVEDCLS